MAPRMPTFACDLIIQCDPPETVWSDDEDILEEERETSIDDLLSSNQIYLAVRTFGWEDVVNRLQETQLALRDENDDTVLHRAFQYRAPNEYIDRLISSYLQKSNENLVNSEGLSYFHIACTKSKLEYVREFLGGTNVDVNAQVQQSTGSFYAGYAALHFAVEYGNVDVAAYLLKNNASIYVQDANGATPLHLACYLRNIDMIDLLLAHDRDYINTLDKFRTSHFMVACISTNSHFAERYLIHAPTALVSDVSLFYLYHDYTPLHFAAKLGRLETTKMLLSRGASCCALTADNETPSEIASKWFNTDVCGILKQHCESYHGAQNAQSQINPESSLDTTHSSFPCTHSVHRPILD